MNKNLKRRFAQGVAENFVKPVRTYLNEDSNGFLCCKRTPQENLYCGSQPQVEFLLKTHLFVSCKKTDGHGSLSSILKQLGTVGFSTLLKHYFQLCLNTHCTNEYFEQQVHVLFVFMMIAHVTEWNGASHCCVLNSHEQQQHSTAQGIFIFSWGFFFFY